MSLLGKAAVVMWWNTAPEHRVEFEDWHSHEHFHERMSIPGFLRGSRWQSCVADDEFFVMYELDAYETLTSAHYLARLNAPTPWSVRMMPLHQRMVRSQCVVVGSFGGGIAAFMTTTRLSPQPDRCEALQQHLLHELAKLPCVPGITGGHLLQTRTPMAGPTEEQRIRGGDAVADWIVLVSGYDRMYLADATLTQLSASSLAARGAQDDAVTSIYGLRYTMTPHDL